MIGKNELALQYSPKATPRMAWRTLKGWIEYNPSLLASLKKLGYDKNKKTFTPAQVRMIYKYIGEP